MSGGQWTWDGYTFGLGTDDVVRSVDLGAHDLRSQRVVLPQNHGGVGGDDWAGFRQVELELAVNRSTREAAELAWDGWLGRMQPASVDGELRWERHDGTTRLLFCRPQPLVVSWVRAARGFDARVRWVAYDPALYSGTLTSETVGPYALSGGLSYPVTYPKVYGSAGSGGGVTVENSGNWPSWPKFRIDGPTSGAVTVLAIEDATNGEAITFDGLEVASGSTLIVDTHPARRVVQFVTGADRLNTVVDLDSWFAIEGSAEIRLRASGSTAGATLTTELRSAWL